MFCKVINYMRLQIGSVLLVQFVFVIQSIISGVPITLANLPPISLFLDQLEKETHQFLAIQIRVTYDRLFLRQLLCSDEVICYPSTPVESHRVVSVEL